MPPLQLDVLGIDVLEPTNFEEANVSLAPPEGVSEDDVGTLRVLRAGGDTYSCWKPSRAELDEIERTGRVYWHFRHEPCVMGWRKGSKPEHDGTHEFDSVWNVDYDGLAKRSTDHQASKPVELFARPMRKHTRQGAIVFEPFCGSGSQIIAAENLKRVCRAIELEPAYVDVAVRRWQDFAKKEATLFDDGRSFAAVAADRAGEKKPKTDVDG